MTQSRSTGSPQLHDDLSLSPPFFEIGQGLFRLIEWENFVDDWPDFSRLEKFADFRELSTIWMHEEK
jgi:hypothetical protein